MSGGERKKRSDRGHGWEEAGAEFYQESYPAAMEADLQQALQRDPSHIATLLPSKKSRVATTKRVRHEPRTTLRRRTSTRSRCASTARRMSTNVHDAQVSMLPDLSENLSNEERTWEEIMQIKAMPVCMAQKMQLKNQLQSATKLRLQGFDQLKWQRRKAWQQFRSRVKETYAKISLWNSSLKKIGGNFGMGIVTYFLFIKWLLFLNLSLFMIIFIFLILPTILLEAPQPDICIANNTNNTNNTNNVDCCSELYNNGSKELNGITDFMQGNNFLEYTLLYYGYYAHKSYGNIESGIFYDLPLAYIGAMMSMFFVSLVAIVRSSAREFRERVVEGEGQFYQYCNLIFGGWDYCINNEKAAGIKHKALFNEMKVLLESERLEEERQNRTKEEKVKLHFIRLIVNSIVLLVLGCCGIFIYYIIDFSFHEVSSKTAQDYSMEKFSLNTLKQILFEFLPYICIVGLNIIVPFIFRYLVTLENYSPLFVVRITLFRTIFLRLASLAVLLTSFHKMIVGDVPENECTDESTKRPLCWETFVGQQFLKLYLTDFITQIILTLFVNFPRSLLARHSENKILRFIGEQQFDLPKQVLDVVYSQTICWLGAFFVPLLPLVAAIGSFFIFYIKKFACLINSTPSSQVYRTSRSKSLFMFVLLITYILAIIPVGYYVVKLTPSKACGPFKGLKNVWSLMLMTFSQFPNWLQSFTSFLGTAGFGVPAFVLLALLVYYYFAVATANKHMVTVLKNQLVLEGHDKQFLLNRLSAFIKQQQEQSKYHQGSDLGTFT